MIINIPTIHIIGTPLSLPCTGSVLFFCLFSNRFKIIIFLHFTEKRGSANEGTSSLTWNLLSRITEGSFVSANEREFWGNVMPFSTIRNYLLQKKQANLHQNSKMSWKRNVRCLQFPQHSPLPRHLFHWSLRRSHPKMSKVIWNRNLGKIFHRSLIWPAHQLTRRTAIRLSKVNEKVWQQSIWKRRIKWKRQTRMRTRRCSQVVRLLIVLKLCYRYQQSNLMQ